MIYTIQTITNTSLSSQTGVHWRHNKQVERCAEPAKVRSTTGEHGRVIYDVQYWSRFNRTAVIKRRRTDGRVCDIIVGLYDTTRWVGRSANGIENETCNHGYQRNLLFIYELLRPASDKIWHRDSASTEKSHRGYITMSTMLSHNNHAVVVRSFNVVDTMHGILYNSYYARVPWPMLLSQQQTAEMRFDSLRFSAPPSYARMIR